MLTITNFKLKEFIVLPTWQTRVHGTSSTQDNMLIKLQNMTRYSNKKKTHNMVALLQKLCNLKQVGN
jgi:hypothetical protein